MAAVLLVIVGTSLSGVLASSVAPYSSSREHTLAEQLADGPGRGDPPACRSRRWVCRTGTHPAPSRRRVQSTGPSDCTGTMTLQVSYVDDQTPNKLPDVRELQEGRRHRHPQERLEAADAAR